MVVFVVVVVVCFFPLTHRLDNGWGFVVEDSGVLSVDKKKKKKKKSVEKNNQPH